MFFLNLSAGEFFALLGVLGGTVTALYFLDRSKRRKVVSTLQFWVSASGATEQRSRKKVNQPWSLILQLVSLLLLLLAIAQLQWGTRPAAGRDHVLLVDTSAWSNARQSSQGSANATSTVLQQEMTVANRLIGSLPGRDRVLLARADALVTPVTTFTSDRDQLRAALRAMTSSASALNLAGALAYAEQAQRNAESSGGEIIYVGPERVKQGALPVALPANLRVLATPAAGSNRGIRRVEARRSGGESDSWQVQIAVMNYADQIQTLTLRTQFAGTRFAPRTYRVPAHQEINADYTFVTNTGGELRTALDGTDAIEQDNQASLQLPGSHAFAVTVYTKRPDLWRPLLRADRRIQAKFLDPAQPFETGKTDLAIFDQVTAARPVSVASIWIDPSAASSPVPVKVVAAKGMISHWNAESSLAAGLHAKEERANQLEIFNPRPGDLVLATAKSSIGADAVSGPVVVVTPSTSTQAKRAVIGYDPLESHLRFTVTTPLLFANLLDWMAPEGAHTNEFQLSHVGAASVSLAPEENADDVQVIADDRRPLAYTVHDQMVQLFTNTPLVAQLKAGGRTRALALTLPDVAEAMWTPAKAARGLPGFTAIHAAAVDLWRWLACLGGLGLVAEWFLFGRTRSAIRRSTTRVSEARATAPEEQLVSR